MAPFLDIEEEELAAQAKALDSAAFRAWYDNSPIKARHKKSCMIVQGLRCCYCRKFFGLAYNNIWDLEHVLSEQDYPQFFAVSGNLAIACKPCNIAKSSKDVLRADYVRPPETLPPLATDYKIPHPLLTNWNDHVAHSNFLVYRGKTDEGIELLSVCKLNAPVLEKAGLTLEMVETSIITNFFAVLGPVVPHDLPHEQIGQISNDLQEAQENQRRDIILVGLKEAVARTERALRKKAEKAKAAG